MENKTPLQKAKEKELDNLINENKSKAEPDINPDQGRSSNFNSENSENIDTLNNLIIKRTQEEISSFVNLQGFICSTLESLGLNIEKNETALNEYKIVIQNNVIEEFSQGNIDWRFYSAILNNKMSLWIGGTYLIAMPIVKAIAIKKKEQKEAIINNLNGKEKPAPEKQPKKEKKEPESYNLQDNIARQYN